MRATLKTALFAMLLASIPTDKRDQGDGQMWWPQFLGPQRNGMSTEKNLNTDWKTTRPKVLWKVPLGDGFSSFAVVGDRALRCASGPNAAWWFAWTPTPARKFGAGCGAGLPRQAKARCRPALDPDLSPRPALLPDAHGRAVLLVGGGRQGHLEADQFKDTGRQPGRPEIILILGRRDFAVHRG